MTGALIKGGHLDTETYQQEVRHVKMEAELYKPGVTTVISKPPEARGVPGTDSPSQPQKEPALPLPSSWTSGLQTVRESKSLWFKLAVCGALLWLP